MIKINEIRTEDIFAESRLTRIRTKDVHLVCLAKPKESFCSKCLAGHLGMSVYDIERYCNAVNGKKDPGCLYPLHAVTLFPVALGLDLERCVGEVWKAQTDYFKSPEMLFVFEENEFLDNHSIKSCFINLFQINSASDLVANMYFG
jgi:hypothetical protein